MVCDERGGGSLAARGCARSKGLTRSMDIRRVAQTIGVSPGVAVAAMHKKRMLDYSYGNDLMVDLVG